MANYIVYKNTTGEIVQTGFVPDGLETQQSRDASCSAVVVSQQPPLGKARFDLGTGEVVAIPANPNSTYTWDWNALAWGDARTLAQAQTAKWASIKIARATEIDAPLTTSYGTFDSNAASRANITDAAAMLQTLAAAGAPITIDFTLADNSTVTLNTTQMVAVGLALGHKVQAAYAKGRTLRAQIDAATTVSQVDAIAW